MYISNEQLLKGKNNFDFIRFFAAFLVFFAHSFPIFTGISMDFDLSKEIFGIRISSLGVYIFFIISGFLVTQSFYNSKNIFIFFINRILRILPALIGVTLISVIILGLFFSKLNFLDFISDKTTMQFYQNMFIYRSYYYLPDVFLSNPMNSSINGSIWTIPFEFTCYLILPIVLLIPKLNNKFGILLLTISCFLAYLFFENEINKIVIPFLGIVFSSFFVFFILFLTGVCFYKFKNSINFNYKGLIIILFLLLLIKFKLIPSLTIVFILPYIVFYFVFSAKINLHNFAKFGDLSYGFYLYAYPVQQAISAVYYNKLPFLSLFCISFLITLIFANISWFAIEKPALKLKTKLNFLLKDKLQ